MLDLGTMVTAPLAAMMLGQLGAEVTKVEHPAGGDPFRKTTGGDYSPNFVAYNQNKTSVQIDLTTPDGRARLFEMVAATDILIENFRPGVMDRLGLDANARDEGEPPSHPLLHYRVRQRRSLRRPRGLRHRLASPYQASFISISIPHGLRSSDQR